MPTLPPLYACEFCHTELRPDSPGTWRLVTGWVQSRKGGGANAVRDQSAPQAYACDTCMNLRKYGPPTQEQLF